MTNPTYSRQIVFSAVDTVQLSEQEVPPPASDGLIVRVHAVGICATDLHLLEGHIGDPFPLVPGHEFVGEVAAAGPASAHGVSVGDRVAVEMLIPCGSCPRCREGRYNLCDADDMSTGRDRGRQYGVNIPRSVVPGLWGGYADVIAVPREAIVHRLPDDLPWNEAVLVEPLAVAFRAVSRGRVSPGDRVAIIGPGPVGILAAAAASASGAARVALLGTRDERLEHARAFGADSTVNVRTSGDVGSDTRAALGGEADVVIELAGVPAAQQQAAQLVRRGGRVVLAGACGAEAPVTFLADEELLTREIDVLPSFLSAGGFEPAIALLSRRSLPFSDLVTHQFDLENVEDAFETIRERRGGVIKAVLRPDGGR